MKTHLAQETLAGNMPARMLSYGMGSSFTIPGETFTNREWLGGTDSNTLQGNTVNLSNFWQREFWLWRCGQGGYCGAYQDQRCLWTPALTEVANSGRLDKETIEPLCEHGETESERRSFRRRYRLQSYTKGSFSTYHRLVHSRQVQAYIQHESAATRTVDCQVLFELDHAIIGTTNAHRVFCLSIVMNHV